MAIKEARKRAGKSVAEVAAVAGVTEGAVYQWELGMTRPSTDKLPRLAKFLGCTIEELIVNPEDAESG